VPEWIFRDRNVTIVMDVYLSKFMEMKVFSFLLF